MVMISFRNKTNHDCCGETEIIYFSAGEYKVRASNKFGWCQSTCSLSVKAGKRLHAISTQTSVQQQEFERENTTKASPPSFVSRPEASVAVAEGEKAMALEVEVRGEPEPEVEWIKDGRKVQPGKGTAWDRFVVTRQGNKWNLLISDVQVSE